MSFFAEHFYLFADFPPNLDFLLCTHFVKYNCIHGVDGTVVNYSPAFWAAQFPDTNANNFSQTIFPCFYIGMRSGAAKLRWSGARSVFFALISLKRRVSAARPKPFSNKIKPIRSMEETGNAWFSTLLSSRLDSKNIFLQI